MEFKECLENIKTTLKITNINESPKSEFSIPTTNPNGLSETTKPTHGTMYLFIGTLISIALLVWSTYQAMH